MSLRSLEQVNTEIESLQNKLKLLEMEKKIINFCEQYNISDSKREKITDLTVNTFKEYHSEGEYSHLNEGWLEIIFKRGGVQRKLRIDYRDYSPDDDNDRYGTSYHSDLYCTHPEDPVLKKIYNESKQFIDDGEHLAIYNRIILQIHN
tara:strand:- start:803 stop:1246 length:444 start_codon:yes stop_codon:yes gene_type:complete